MSDLRKKDRIVRIIRWVARIWSIVAIAFVLVFLIASLGEGDRPSCDEAVGMFFFLGLFVGLIIAWKWEGLGGVIAIGGIIAFHLTMLVQGGSLDIELFIELLAAPGVLFLLCWLLSRGRLETKKGNTR